MSEKIKEVNNFQDTMYAQSLPGETVNISYLGYLVSSSHAPMVDKNLEPYHSWTLYS